MMMRMSGFASYLSAPATGCEGMRYAMRRSIAIVISSSTTAAAATSALGLAGAGAGRLLVTRGVRCKALAEDIGGIHGMRCSVGARL